MTDWQIFLRLFFIFWACCFMIAIEEARIVLWKDAEMMDDKQVQDLLDLLYSICSIVWDKNGLNKPKNQD